MTSRPTLTRLRSARRDGCRALAGAAGGAARRLLAPAVGVLAAGVRRRGVVRASPGQLTRPAARRRGAGSPSVCRGWRSACAGCGSSPCPGTSSRRSLFAGFHAAAAAIAPTGPWRTIGRPAAHTLVETIRLGFPFGGVPLATLGIAQAGGPLLGVARIGGVILLTWIVFQVGCALAGPGTGRSAPLPRRVVGGERAGTAGVDGQPHGVLALLGDRAR